MAFAATALLAITSCSKSDDNGGGGESGGGVVTLTPPPYKDATKNLIITGKTADGITQLRMMGSGAYMITRQAVQASTRAAAGGNTYEFGKYTYSGGTYKFDNGMTIKVEPADKNYDVTITWKNGTTITTTGTIDTSAAVTAGVWTDNLTSHAWTIDRMLVTSVFEGVKLGKEFSAPIDLAAVKAWYEENFGKLKDQFDANTIILGIYFDANGLFAINYKNRDSDVGVWRWKEMNAGNLVYSWNDKAQAISLFTGDASAEFEKSPETCKLTLKGRVNNIDFEFKFILK